MDILILGSSGMLGSMVLDYLSTKNLNITAPPREELDKVRFDKYDYIINCIGIIKQKLTDPKEAILINSLFPYTIAEKAPKAKIIQIATDCAYSGRTSPNSEDKIPDPIDVYGRTKRLGEVEAKNFYNIRTSIVGIEPSSNVSLLSWFLSQKKNAHIKGYANHYWNGITTLHFAALCYAIIKRRKPLPNSFHFVPEDSVSKYKLLKIFAEKFNRRDIVIKEWETEKAVDRTLFTKYNDIVDGLWKQMGYEIRPTIEGMVEELAHYVRS